MPTPVTNNTRVNLEAGMKLALLGIAINAVLAMVKLLAGYFGNSYALIADGIESTLDIAASFIIWAGLKLAAKPPDADHPYGHGKAEPVASIVVACTILFAAAGLAVQSVKGILTQHHAPAAFTLIVLVAVVVTKESLYRFVMWWGNKTGSTAIKTDAGHHRADVITSVAAFIGISIALIGGKGWEPADDWAALFACGLIAYNGMALLKPGLYEIMDTAPPKGVEDEVRRAAASVKGVENVEQCRIRKMGLEFYVDLHVWVDGGIPVSEGHRIAHEVKDVVKQVNPAVADVMVHVEPRRDNEAGKPITRSDIVGARVVDVFEKHKLNEGLDFTLTYYIVDRGFCFTIPFPGARWEMIALPRDVERVEGKMVDEICKRKIAGVCVSKPAESGAKDPREVRVELDDGSWFYDLPVAPQGLGWTGARYFPPDKVEREKFIDFWEGA